MEVNQNLIKDLLSLGTFGKSYKEAKQQGFEINVKFENTNLIEETLEYFFSNVKDNLFQNTHIDNYSNEFIVYLFKNKFSYPYLLKYEKTLFENNKVDINLLKEIDLQVYHGLNLLKLIISRNSNITLKQLISHLPHCINDLLEQLPQKEKTKPEFEEYIKNNKLYSALKDYSQLRQEFLENSFEFLNEKQLYQTINYNPTFFEKFKNEIDLNKIFNMNSKATLQALKENVTNIPINTTVLRKLKGEGKVNEDFLKKQKVSLSNFLSLFKTAKEILPLIHCFQPQDLIQYGFQMRRATFLKACVILKLDELPDINITESLKRDILKTKNTMNKN